MFFWKCKIYVFAQFLSGMDYTNCIRTEKGYCAIEWKEKTGATPGRWNDIWIDVNVHCWLTVPSLESFVLTTVLRSKLDNLDNHNNISDEQSDESYIYDVTNISRPLPSFCHRLNSCGLSLPIYASLCSKHEVALLHHELRHECHCNYESHQKTKNRLILFNVSYDGIKTLGASAPTASTAATYQYQSRTFHLFKMIQNTRRTWM